VATRVDRVAGRASAPRRRASDARACLKDRARVTNEALGCANKATSTVAREAARVNRRPPPSAPSAPCESPATSCAAIRAVKAGGSNLAGRTGPTGPTGSR